MKTCFLVSKSDLGGATVYVHNLRNEIGITTDLFYLYKGSSVNQIEYQGKHVSSYETLSIGHFPILILKLIKELQAKRFDLINVHSTEASIILRVALIFLKVKPKVVYTVHGWGWRGFSVYKSLFIKFIEYTLSKIIPVTYVFLYDEMRAECSFISKIKYERIITGIPSPKELREYQIPKDRPPTFLFPARVDRAKDHLSALKVLTPFKEQNLKLVFVGAETNSETFKNKINLERLNLELNNLQIEFIGVSKNMKEHYLSTDFVMLLSHFEALPLTIIEALSYGIPCIVSNVGGNKDLIDNELNGVITNSNNELEKKETNFILDCLNNSKFYREVCVNSIKKFNTDLSIHSMTIRYKNLFYNLVERN